jgi:hypothetical protein
VEPRPGGAVAAEADLPLQFQRRNAALAGGDEIDGQEPAREVGLGLLEDGPGEDRMLLATGPTLLDQPLVMAVRPIMAAAPAAKAFRPTRLDETGPTLRVGPKPLQKARQVAGQVVEERLGHGVLQQCSAFVRYVVSRPPSSGAPTHPERSG